MIEEKNAHSNAKTIKKLLKEHKKLHDKCKKYYYDTKNKAKVNKSKLLFNMNMRLHCKVNEIMIRY